MKYGSAKILNNVLFWFVLCFYASHIPLDSYNMIVHAHMRVRHKEGVWEWRQRWARGP